MEVFLLAHHETHFEPSSSADSGSALYLPVSIILSAIILAGAIFYSGYEIGGKLSTVSASLKTLQLTAQVPQGAGGIGNAAPSQPEQPAPAPAVQINMQKLSQGYPTKGDAKAPVTIVEFSDFQCPFCASWFKGAYSQINENYIKTGKAKLVFRHFPLSFHPEAQPAANASECANEQGRFWEMHDKIFNNQEQMNAANYKAWAKDLGLDTTKFNSCYDSKKYNSKVTADFSEGSGVGVSGTPTFFVNGQKIVGAQPFEAFKPAIDAALNE